MSHKTKRVLRLQDVVRDYGLSRSTIYRLIAQGLFPAPVRLGLAAVGWDAADLDTWYSNRKATSNQGVRHG